MREKIRDLLKLPDTGYRIFRHPTFSGYPTGFPRKSSKKKLIGKKILVEVILQ